MNKRTGLGNKFYVKIGTAYTQIKGIKDFDFPDAGLDVKSYFEVLNSFPVVYPGDVQVPVCKLTGFSDYEDSTQTYLIQAMIQKTATDFRIDLAGGKSISFNGYVGKVTRSSSVDNANSLTVEVSLTSLPTWS